MSGAVMAIMAGEQFDHGLLNAVSAAGQIGFGGSTGGTWSGTLACMRGNGTPSIAAAFDTTGAGTFAVWLAASAGTLTQDNFAYVTVNGQVFASKDATFNGAANPATWTWAAHLAGLANATSYHFLMSY